MGAWMRSRKGYVMAMQWLLVGVVAVWGAATGAWRASPTVFWTIVGLSAVGNVALMRMPLPYFYQPTHWMFIFLADTVFVGASIYCMGGFNPEFYLPYFFIMLIAALTRSLARVVAVALSVSAVYMFLVWSEGDAVGLLDTAYLIRLPFFLVIALFTSYLANAARLQQEAQQASRALTEQVQSLQELAAGIAHEVRNPLTAISNDLQVIRGRLPHDGEARGIVQEALEQVDRVTRIVQETLELARPAAFQPHWLDVNKRVDYAVRHTNGADGSHGIEVRKRLAPSQLMLWGDPDLLEQALLNIMRNAVEAMPEGGTLNLETTLVMRQGQEQVVVRIADTGAGFSPHQLERLYQPFYTTKPRGTGLGLSLARKFVRAHGGDLKIVSQVDRGTEVTITLPVTGPLSAAGVPQKKVHAEAPARR